MSKKKKESSEKNEKKSNVRVQKENANKKEIWAILMIAVCIFAFVCIIGQAGIVGNIVKLILCGLFGYVGAVILLIVVVVLAIAILRGTTRQTFTAKRTLVLFFLCLFLIALLHTFSGAYELIHFNKNPGFFSIVGTLFSSYETKPLAGGLLGGGLSTLLIYYTTNIGAFVILIPGTLVFAMLLFKFSLLPFFEKTGSVFGKMGKGISSFFKRLTAKNTTTANQKVNIYLGDEKLDEEIDKAEEITQSAAVEKQETEQEAPTVFVFDDIPFPELDEEHKFPSEEDAPPFDVELVAKEEEPAENPEAQPQSEPINVDKVEPAGNNLPVLSKGEFSDYEYPSLDYLELDMKAKKAAAEISKAECDITAKKLQETLSNFGVEARVDNAYIGPTVTRYELTPRIGTRMEAFKRLSDEIAFYLAAESIRIEAPIPGKSAVGIEVPNKKRSTVYLKEILSSEKFRQSKSKLTCAIGADIQNTPIVCDISKLPHLLIGGTTGSGKSVCTNGIIMSLLYKSSPEEVRLILIDPKMVEFEKYNGIPHLLLPVVTDPKKAASALSWAVLEMDKRYAFFSANHVSNIDSYNKYAEENGMPKMPRIVIIIDELADLMMVAKQNVEIAINRIAQKARACGMHLIVATQSPRVDVVTGLIKANIGSRIGLSVANGTDSRIILDATGAEKLLGRGDMIYAPITESKQIRVQGAFASDDEIKAVVDAISNKKRDNYLSEVNDFIEKSASPDAQEEKGDKAAEKENEKADLYQQAIQLAMEAGEISTSYIQRRLGIGYNRAADIMDRMVEDGIIERGVGSKKSKVIKRL